MIVFNKKRTTIYINLSLFFITAPGAPYTHWKQTVFYLEEDITCKRGEELCGTIKVGQNKDNKRDLDFEVQYEFYGKLSQVSLQQKYKMR